MTRSIPYFSFLLLFLACAPTTQKTDWFTLHGRTHDIPDGTLVQLIDPSENTVTDSTRIKDNLFVFRGQLDASPAQRLLLTEGLPNFALLWLEPTEMTFDASTTDFRRAIVTGSVTQAEADELRRRTNDADEATRNRITQDFIAEFPSSTISVNALSVMASTYGRETTEKLYHQLSPALQQTDYGKDVEHYLSLNQEPQVGDRFAEVALQNPSGETVRLSERLGKLTLLEFWGANCAPCRQENPHLVRTYETYHPRGFDIYAVSLDRNRDQWLAAIEADGLPWTQVADLDHRGNAAQLTYGVHMIPDNFLIDEKGIIVARNLRGEALDRELAARLGSEAAQLFSQSE